MAPGNAGQTHPGTGASGGAAILDWIMTQPSVTVQDAEVIQFEIPPGEEDDFSDHLPVTALLELSAPSGVGEVPDGNNLPGEPLTVDRAQSGEITLSWTSSCLTSDVDYHAYRGMIGDFYSHAQFACTTGGATARRP